MLIYFFLFIVAIVVRKAPNTYYTGQAKRVHYYNSLFVPKRAIIYILFKESEELMFLIGTALDLPYVYPPDRTLQPRNQAGATLKETGNNFMRGGIVEGLMGLASGAQLLMKSPASKANTVAQKT